MLDVRRLSILREVAQQGSFSAAADVLYLSQSAVSQQIATLEREVGMQLLDRTREGPKLTDAGRVLVSHADAAIARLEEAERELAAIAGLEGGELRLASFPSASATVLTEAVSVFHGRHPGVRLSVADAEPEESLPRLRAGEIDLALSFDYPSVPAARGARPRAHADPHRVDVRRVARGPRARQAPGRPAHRALRPRLALRLARVELRRGRRPRVPRRRLRAPDRLRVRRLPRDAGLHLRRPRRHPAPRPGAADASQRPRRPRRPTRRRRSAASGPRPAPPAPARPRPRRWSGS